MKLKIAALFVWITFGLSAASFAFTPSAGATGAGFILGDPLGPRLKTFITRNEALDVGVGVADDIEFYGDVVFHGWNVLPKPERGEFSPYMGVGPRYEARNHARDHFGARLVGGISYFVDNAPIELYIELAPVIDIAPKLDSDFDGGFGVHLYFLGH